MGKDGVNDSTGILPVLLLFIELEHSGIYRSALNLILQKGLSRLLQDDMIRWRLSL